MKLALKEAEIAKENDEIPVGAIIVKNDIVISTSGNFRERNNDAIAHAECCAISKACAILGGWNLHDCDIYVTLEPCTMCAGAIINSRIKNVYIGASDPKAGAFGGRYNINSFDLNHKPVIKKGILEEECSVIIKEYFAEVRKRGKRWKAK